MNPNECMSEEKEATVLHFCTSQTTVRVAAFFFGEPKLVEAVRPSVASSNAHRVNGSDAKHIQEQP